MANAYTVKVISIVSDGTDIFLEIQINTGSQTLPVIRPTFPVGTTRASIVSYIQNIANTQPTLPTDLPDLVSATIVGA
jgi:hypothetical protein